MDGNVSVPKALWDKFMEFINVNKPTEPPTPEPVKVEETEAFKAAAKERDDFKAKLEAKEADDAKKALVANLTAQLQKKEDYGMVYVELKAADEAAGVLATMDETQREWVLRNFKALIAQIDESQLTGEEGRETAATTDEDHKARFNAIVLKMVNEGKGDYNQCFAIAKETEAELFQTAFGKKK